MVISTTLQIKYLIYGLTSTMYLMATVSWLSVNNNSRPAPNIDSLLGFKEACKSCVEVICRSNQQAYQDIFTQPYTADLRFTFGA